MWSLELEALSGFKLEIDIVQNIIKDYTLISLGLIVARKLCMPSTDYLFYLFIYQ